MLRTLILLASLHSQALVHAQTIVLPSEVSRIDDITDDSCGGQGDQRDNQPLRVGDNNMDKEMRSILQFPIRRLDAEIRAARRISLQAPVQSVLGAPSPLQLLWISSKDLPGIGIGEFHAEALPHEVRPEAKPNETLVWDITPWVREALEKGHAVLTLRLESSAPNSHNTNGRPDNVRIAHNPADSDVPNIHLLCE